MFLLGALAATLACGDKVCLLAPNPSVLVDIRDSLTGVRIANRASLIVEGLGVYDSTYFAPNPDSLIALFVSSAPPRRTGEYTVRVRKDSYALWQQSNVHVEGDGCTAAPSPFFTVRLQRVP